MPASRTYDAALADHDVEHLQRLRRAVVHALAEAQFVAGASDSEDVTAAADLLASELDALIHDEIDGRIWKCECRQADAETSRWLQERAKDVAFYARGVL